MSGKKGDRRLARLRTLISRAQQRCAARAAELREARAYLVAIAQRLDPLGTTTPEPTVTGAAVRAQVEALLDEVAAAIAEERIPEWLRAPLDHLVVVLRRLGDGLYYCYDVPDLPRTNNALEQFYRALKTTQRRITGHKRADAFVMRVGGFAVYATTAHHRGEADICRQLATVAAADWRRQRAELHATQLRQTKMRRFHLRRAAYLADLEARWAQHAEPP